MIVSPIILYKANKEYKKIYALLEKAEKLNDQKAVAKYKDKIKCIQRLFLLS